MKSAASQNSEELMTLRERLPSKSWRVNNLYSIINKDAQRIQFTRNRVQEHFNANKAQRNIILKSRQHGFTTDEVVDTLDDCLFMKNYKALFIAHTKEIAGEIFDQKVNYAWNNLPEWLKDRFTVENNTGMKIKLGFGDGTVSSFIVSNSGRAGTNNRVHISEFAKMCRKFPERADEVITGTIPSVPLDGRIDIEGTGEGIGGHFHKMFWEAWERGEPQNPSQFKAHFYNWTWDDAEIAKVPRVIPYSEMEEGGTFKEYAKLHSLSPLEITYYYLKWQSLNKNWDMLHQEYPTTPEEAFIASGTPYFEAKRLVEYIKRAPEPIKVGFISLDIDKNPLFDENETGDCKIWEMPDPYTGYTLGGDVAEGIEGGDWSTIEVINNKTLRCAAKVRTHCPPNEYARIVYALGMMYNRALVGVEVNKDGLWVNTVLFEDLKYPNMYFREEFDDVAHKVGRKIGFRTDQTTRPTILAELKGLINTKPDIWTNTDFLRECLVFVRNKNGRPESISGEHDDEVMATAIAYAIRGSAVESYAQPIAPERSAQGIVQARLAALKKRGTDKRTQSSYY